MATLILYDNENLKDFVKKDEVTSDEYMWYNNIDVVIYKIGKETIILKSSN